MVSDQMQALERDNVFDFSDTRKFLKVRKPKDNNDVVPQIIC